MLGSATAGSVSGGSVSDSHSDGGAGDDADTAAASNGSATINGEEVRAGVETFLKRQIVRTVTSGIAFGMAIVGLWGDGLRTVPVWQETLVVV